MADFNKVLTPGDYEKGELNVVIEMVQIIRLSGIGNTLVLCLIG